MSTFEDRVLERRRQFKKAVDGDDARRLREDEAVQLRKKDKEEQLAKKRMNLADNEMPMSPSMPSTQAPADLPTLVRAVRNFNDPQNQYLATQAIRKQLSVEKNPQIQAVIDSGVVPDFIKLLYLDRPDIQFEAAWALTNIASGNREQTRVVLQAGGVPVFVRLLTEGSTDDVKDQAVWALGNIAGDTPECRDIVLREGALQPVLTLCKVDKQNMQRNATWTLSNLCRGKPPPPMEVIRPALPTLVALVHSQDANVLSDACWALSYFTEGNQNIAAVVDSGVLRRIVELLGHPATLVQTPALRIVGNVVTGDDNQTQAAIQVGTLHMLRPLLQHSTKSIRKEACWTISNISAGNTAQIQEVINADLLPVLVKMLMDDENDVKKEVCWAISNATSGGSLEQVQNIVKMGAIAPLVDVLTWFDMKICPVALEALENILKTGKILMERNDLPQNEYCALIEQCGLEKIQDLADGCHNPTFVRAGNVLKFFDQGDDGMMADHYAVPPQGFGF